MDVGPCNYLLKLEVFVRVLPRLQHRKRLQLLDILVKASFQMFAGIRVRAQSVLRQLLDDIEI